MNKWADFVISQVNYDSCHLIFKALRHKDSLNGIDDGTLVDRLTIISDIKNGLNYITVYSGLSSWKRGHKIRILKTDDQFYIRIDDNKVKLDNLGDLPELSSSILSQESEEPTREQFARVEELERQIKNIESQHKKTSILSGNSLTTNIVNTTQKPASALKTEEEPTREQFARVEELEKQIRVLELNNSKENRKYIKTEHEVIQALRKQYQKLDAIENNLRSLDLYAIKTSKTIH